MNDAEFAAALAAENKNAPAISLGFDDKAKPGRCNVIFPDTKESCGSPAAFRGVGDCLHFRVCFQCARPYAKGGRPLEALERIEIPSPENACQVFRPTRWQRFVRWLFPQSHKNRFDRMDEKDPFQVRDAIRSEVVAVLDWKDRLRVLFSGRCSVSLYIRCENVVGATDSVSDFNALPPAWMDKEAGQ